MDKDDSKQDKPDRQDGFYKDLLCAIASGLYAQPGARPEVMGEVVVAAADAVFMAHKRADKPDDKPATDTPPEAGASDSSGAPKLPPGEEVPPEHTPMPGDAPKAPDAPEPDKPKKGAK